eukprot:TRINITY_DN3658_c0_g1_i2.p2 TRINITY_DN3658_c0_g1~~TRINITY_DN3658_c0_g1_i2.p2  ORF type:complete len:169 (-),score=24.49 TRINITY_DN3658_c0_g1_i2:87-593(-)
MAYLNNYQSMLEIGSGFSTMWYSQFVNSYVSIEHDKMWGAKVEKMIADTPGQRNISYHVTPVEGWDFNLGDGNEQQFKPYLDKIDEVSRGRTWDVSLGGDVFIVHRPFKGRFFFGNNPPLLCSGGKINTWSGDAYGFEGGEAPFFFASRFFPPTLFERKSYQIKLSLF